MGCSLRGGLASPKRSVGGYSIKAIMSAFQAEDTGSIPVTRSKIKLP